MSSANYGTGQCGYAQSSYGIQQQDYQHSQQVQMQNIQAERAALAQRMGQLNQQLLNARNGLYYYFDPQWANAMINHMDNGFDCCAPGTTAVSSNAQTSDRRPAGTDAVGLPNYDGEQPVDTTPYMDEPAETPTSTCYGYAQNYCQGDWGQNESPGYGGFCLQTGFAATAAWYGRACRGDGKIDPGVCQTQSKYPNDYQQCVQVLNYYYQMSYEKRRMAAQIQAYNNQINYYGRNNGSSFGNFLGSFIGTVGPFLLGQYLNYRAYQNVRYQYQSYPYQGNGGYGNGYGRGYGNGYGSGNYAYGLGQPNSLAYRSNAIQIPYHSQNYAPAPNYYGQQYGYPYQYASNYGGILPALAQGAFGCSQGFYGNGLGSLFGTFLGAGASLYGNAGYGGGPAYNAPYQVGGIYNQPPGYTTQFSPTYTSYPSGSYGARYGLNNYGGDAYFYSRIGEARQRLWSNQAYLANQQYGYAPNNQYSTQYGAQYGGQLGLPQLGYQQPYAQGGFYPGAGFDWNSMVQTLLGGGASASFSLQGGGGYPNNGYSGY